ncbi:hypothetical protein CI238_04732 [Colletotrichum incanum]|uniref:Uncharacterized protein n=1 Tax=Colletotrichum incanum TaxID=1573173 RepID=A0A161Y5E3_COLIC|nr:hypothetical protein CI238_04732 [Colletotrichum incanum]
MSTSGPGLNSCPVDGCNWKPRTAGGRVERHVLTKHGRKMPCGEYALEGNDRDGRDRVKGHQDSCRRCPKDVKDPSDDDNDYNTAITPEPNVGIGGNIRSTQCSINIKNITVHGTIIHKTIVSQTNVHRAST